MECGLVLKVFSFVFKNRKNLSWKFLFPAAVCFSLFAAALQGIVHCQSWMNKLPKVWAKAIFVPGLCQEGTFFRSLGMLFLTSTAEAGCWCTVAGRW